MKPQLCTILQSPVTSFVLIPDIFIINQCIRQKTSTEHSKGNKTVPGKVATTCKKDDTNRLPKQAVQYKPKGRRNIGRPRKRWRDQLHLEDQGTGYMPNPSGT